LTATVLTPHTFTHKQNTQYKERNIHNNKKNLRLIRQVPAVPRLCQLYPAFALQLRKTHGKTSVRVAARTSQADSTVQYSTRTMNSTIHRRKTVTQSSTIPQNTEYTTQKTVHIR
jgi:hypothetical protein